MRCKDYGKVGVGVEVGDELSIGAWILSCDGHSLLYDSICGNGQWFRVRVWRLIVHFVNGLFPFSYSHGHHRFQKVESLFLGTGYSCPLGFGLMLSLTVHDYEIKKIFYSSTQVSAIKI